MGLIEDYKNLLSQSKKYSAELPAVSHEVELHKQTIARLNYELQSLEDESRNITNKRIQQELMSLIQTKRSEFNSQISSVKSKLNALSDKYNSDCQSIKAQTYDSRFSSTREIINEIDKCLNTSNYPTVLPPELEASVRASLVGEQTKFTKSQILKLIQEVKTNRYKPLQQTKQSPFIQSITNFLSLKAVVESKWGNKAKLFVYLLYLFCYVLCLLFVPVLAMTAVSLMLVSRYNQSISSSRALIKLALPVNKLRLAYDQKMNQLTQQVETARTKDLAELENKYQADKEPLMTEMSKLQFDLSHAEDSVRSSFSDKELRESIKVQFDSKQDEIQNKLTQEERKLKVASKQLEVNQRKIAAFEANRKEMLPKIKEAYLNPTKPGMSPYLIKSFLISINETSGALDEFNYNGCSTFIMYKGENSSANKPLITMMLMQFMASMTLASLEIYLTDIQSAGMDYAPFNSCVNITSNINDIKRLLDTVNEELIARRDSIAAVEENIETFNRKRLENHGIAIPYVLLFLQDITISEMTEDSLIQLVANGPRVGIVPIIFINHQYLSSLPELQPDKLTKLVKFMSAFQYTSGKKIIFNTFVFDGQTENLMRNPKITDAILGKVRKKG